MGGQRKREKEKEENYEVVESWKHHRQTNHKLCWYYMHYSRVTGMQSLRVMAYA